MGTGIARHLETVSTTCLHVGENSLYPAADSTSGAPMALGRSPAAPAARAGSTQLDGSR